jgi:hypothetical protein
VRAIVRAHNQMNRITLIVLASLAVWRPAISQTPKDRLIPSRDVSIVMSMGYLEFMTLGFLIQMSDQYALGIVASSFVVSERPGFIVPDNAPGVGIRGTYYLSRDGKNTFGGANAISVDAQYLLPPRRDVANWRPNNLGGAGFEIIIGRDGIVDSGIGILWGVGIAGAFYTGDPPLIMPAIRLGLHIDI